MCYFFYYIINIFDFNFDIILLNEKSYEKFLIFDVSFKTQYCARSLCIIMLDKVDGYVRKYDGTKYLALFHSNENNQIIFYRIRYIIMLKINISDAFSHQYMEIKTNSDDDLTLGKTLNVQNRVILFKSVFNKNHNHCYYKHF